MWLEGARWLQLAVFALWCLSVQHTVNAGAGLMLELGLQMIPNQTRRRSIPNHGFVRYDQISDYDPNMRDLNMYVAGVTDFSECCNYKHTADGTTIGWWFFPNGTEVPKIGTTEGDTWSVWSSRYTEIFLWYRGAEGPSGIYQCDIPLSREANTTQYVGIYPGPDGGTGDPNVTSIQFSLTSGHTVSETLEFDVTCTSEGGPATTVTWTRDGEAVSGDNFTATRRLDDPVTAAYTLTLSVVGRQGGVYRCQVAKGGPGVSGYPVNSSMELTIHAANPPTGLTAVQVGNETARVSWTPPNTTSSESSEPVTGYQIYYMTQGTNGAHVIVNVSTPEAKQEMIHGLQVGLTYSITMVSLSEHLPSELVGPVNVTILEKPAAPNVTTTEITTTSVLLQWTQLGGMNNEPDNFEISFQYTVGSQHEGFCSDYSHSDNITITNVSTRQYNLTGLQEYSAYRITIRAGNGAGKSAPSEIDITTLQTAPSGEPQEVMIVSITSHNITIQWREVPCIHQNSNITGYTVRYSVPGSTTKNTNVSDTVATLIELIPFTNYSIEVAAFSVNGTGPFSTPIYVETLQDTQQPQVDDTPAIIGGVFGGIGIVAIFVILIAVCIGIKLSSYQKNTCDFAETECVAYESARSDKLQACEDEVPVKQCAAYGVIQPTASNPENQNVYMNR